tara:strand:- start:1439 stop:1909 length:471 start_codon:yes stop_codon:yes gene_type:complete
MSIEYFALPNPKFGFQQVLDAAKLVDDSFASGYFAKHLEEIECAWIALDGVKVVGWGAVSECMLRCVVVHPDYRGQGIGKRLTEERLKYLADCERIFSYAWVRPDGTCMSCKNLENFGFKLHKELNRYYSDTRSKCKYCRSNCTCVAKQYVKINQH